MFVASLKAEIPSYYRSILREKDFVRMETSMEGIKKGTLGYNTQ